METKHFRARMEQRGIGRDVVEILKHFGYRIERNKVVLTSKNCQQLSEFIGSELLKLKNDQDCLLSSCVSQA